EHGPAPGEGPLDQLPADPLYHLLSPCMKKAGEVDGGDDRRPPEDSVLFDQRRAGAQPGRLNACGAARRTASDNDHVAPVQDRDLAFHVDELFHMAPALPVGSSTI